MSISPLPRQKWGNMRNTFFRMSLIPPISWKRSEVNTHSQYLVLMSVVELSDLTKSANTQLMNWLLHIYIASKQFQYKCWDTAIDSNKYVNAGQNHVGCAGDLKEEWGWIHQWGDWPSGTRHKNTFMVKYKTKLSQIMNQRNWICVKLTRRAAAAAPTQAD